MTHDVGAHDTVPLSGADYCDVSVGLRLLGDRWSLLIVRELYVGTSRFSSLHRALPGLSRGLLAERLRYLAGIGVVERTASGGSDSRTRHIYALTESGWRLGPVLGAIGEWASEWSPPKTARTAGRARRDLRLLRESIAPDLLPSPRLKIQFLLSDADAVWLRVDHGEVRACHGIDGTDADLTVRSSANDLERLYWGKLKCHEAVATGLINFDGPSALTRAFGTWFPNRPAVSGATT